MLFLLLFVGGMVNEAWAVDYKFKIINNKGKQCLNYTINTTTLTVHQKERSMFATNFRFYTSEDDAIADAYGETGLTYYTEGTAISGISGITDNTFYVRYDMVNNPEIDLSGKTWYYIQARSRYAIKYYVYYDSETDKIIMATDGTGTKPAAEVPNKSDKWLWKFTGNDPYDIYIVNRLGEKSKPDYTLTVAGVGSSSAQCYGSYSTRTPDASYNQSATSDFNLQTFVITQGPNQSDGDNGKYHIIGAYNGIEIKPKDYAKGKDTATEGNMPYYFCANGAPSGTTGNFDNTYKQLNVFRSWRAEDATVAGSNTVGNLSQISITKVETAKVTYHVLNKQNRVAISLTVDQMPSWIDGIRTSELEIPEEIKSPLATNFKYYEASAVSDNGDGTYTVTGSSITELTDQTAPADIYVTYDIDNANPLLVFGASQNYYLQVNGQWIKAASPSATSGTTTFSDAEDQSDYLWKIGLDPYDIQLTNASLSGKVFGSTVTTDATTLQFADSSPTYSSFVLLSGKGTSLALALATGSALANESLPLAYVACSGSGSALTLQRAVNADADDVQVNLHHSNLRDYTYKVYTKTSNGTEVAAVETVAAIAGQVPSLPENIRAAFSSGYQYYEADGTTPLTVLPNGAATIVVKNYTVSEPTMELSGERYYYINVGGKYLYNNSGTLAYATTSATTDNYLWALATTDNDPYHVILRNKANTSLLTQPFVLLPGSADGQYELLQASDTDAKLFLKFGETSPATSRHGAATVQTVFSSPQVSVTMHILNNKNAVAISLPAMAMDGGALFTVPEAYRSPLLAGSAYTFHTSDDLALKESSRLERVPYSGTHTIYVRYTYDPDYSPLDLSGQTWYNWRMVYGGDRYVYYDGSNNSNQARTTETTDEATLSCSIYLWRMLGNDPYDITFTNNAYPNLLLSKISLAYNSNYELYGRTEGTDNTIQHFFITKAEGSSYYQIVAAYNPTEAASNPLFYVEYETSSTNYRAWLRGNVVRNHGDALLQQEFIPRLVYKVVNLNGDVAVSKAAAHDASFGVPEDIKSPLASNWTYYNTLSDAQSKQNAINAKPAKGSVYCRYEYDPATSPVDLGGHTLYTWHFTRRPNYLYGRTTDYIHATYGATLTATNIQNNIYQWYFTGGDPYNITAVNLAFPDKVFACSSALASTDNRFLYLLSPDDAAITASHFMALPGAEVGKYAFAASGLSFNGNLFFLRSESGNENFRIAAGTAINNTTVDTQCELFPYRIYAVIDDMGDEAVRMTVPVESKDDPLRLPHVIKSAHLGYDRFQYYETQATALARTPDISDTKAWLHGTGGIIYVRYTWDANQSTAPIDLDGNVWYTWNYVNVDNRYLHGRGVGDISTNNNALGTRADLTQNPAQNTLATGAYQWRFMGGDPYRIKVENKATPGYIMTKTSRSEAYLYHEGDYNMQRFFITQSEGLSTYQVIGIYDGTDAAQHTWPYYYIRSGNDSGNDTGIPYITNTTGRQDGHDNNQIRFSTPTTYRIINKQGKLVWGDIPGLGNTGEMPDLPNAYKSPLATNYTYYTDGGYDSETDTYTPTNQITAEGYTPSNDGIIYVLYDYDPNNSVTFGNETYGFETTNVDLTGQKSYLINTGHRTSSADTKRFLSWPVENTTKTKAATSTLDGNHPYYQIDKGYSAEPTTLSPNNLWTLGSVDGTPDPYAIVIYNYNHPDYFLSVQNGVMTTGGSTWPWGIHKDETGEGIVRSWALINGTTARPYRLFSSNIVNELNEVDVPIQDGWINRAVYTTADQNSGNSQDADILLLHRRINVAHVVNTMGEIAISSVTPRPDDLSTSISMPDNLKSPLIDETQEGSYRFFRTMEDAYAYSRAKTDAARTAAAAKAITTYSQIAGKNFYIGYYYNPETAPAGSPTLNSDNWYYIYWNNSGTKRYLSRSINDTNHNNENWLWTIDETNRDPEGNASAKKDYFTWKFSGNDPYRIIVTNKYVFNETSQRDVSVNRTNTWNPGGGFAGTEYLFIIRPGSDNGTYQFAMTGLNTNDPAIGTRDYLYYFYFVNANNTMQIARNNDTEFVKDVYTCTRDEGKSITVELITTDKYTYHIIANNGEEVLSYEVANDPGDKPLVPDEIRSPLAGKWRYYAGDAGRTLALADATATAADTKGDHTQTGNITVLGSEKDIYVRYSDAGTYAINTETDAWGYKTGTVTPYSLEFQNGTKYYEESGDKVLFDEANWTVNGIMYPECNGNSQFYVYNEATRQTAFATGSNLRTRLSWYFTGGDPYRLRIIAHNGNTARDLNGDDKNETLPNSFFTTYGPVSGGGNGVRTTLRSPYYAIAVPTYDDTQNKGSIGVGDVYSVSTREKHVGTTMDDVNTADWSTEYMVLAAGHDMKLVTTNPITYTDNEGTHEITDLNERTVRTMEHNWKQYPTMSGWKSWSETDAYPKPNKTQEPLTDAEKEQMGGVYQYDDFLKGYDWNTYPEKAYFSTVNVGERFKLVASNLVPAIHLIDNHGWEVKYWPFPNSSNTNKTEKEKEIADLTNAITKYTSPLVDHYTWYIGNSVVGDASASVSKATGYYKYSFGDKLVPVIESTGDLKGGIDYFSSSTYKYVSGTKTYTATEANHPDIYVTYTVKDQYKDMTLEYFIEQGGKLAEAYSETDGEGNVIQALKNTTLADDVYTKASGETPAALKSSYTDPLDDLLWNLAINPDIDEEMGYVYGGSQGESTYEELQAEYEANGKNGFDPYNIRIRSRELGTYFAMEYDNEGNVITADNSLYLEDGKEVKVTREGRSHNMMQITGTTMMIVRDNTDAHNWRIIPRFEDEETSSTGEQIRKTYALHDLNTVDVAANDGQDGAGTYSGYTEKQATIITPVYQHIYHVVNKSNEIAINYHATLLHPIGSLLVIPEEIRSPLIKNINFYIRATTDGETGKITIDGSSKLPSLPAVGEFWVTYDYDPETVPLLDISGEKYYQFLSVPSTEGTKYANLSDGSYALNSVESKDDLYLWAPTGVEVGGQPDPYQVTLKNRKDGTVIDGGPYIVVMGAADGQFELLKADATDDEESEFEHLSLDAGNSTLSNAVGLTHKTANLQMKFEGIPLNVTYYIINLRDKIATHNVAHCEGGDLLSVPQPIRSPLVNKEDYTFWIANNETNTPESIDGNQYASDFRFGYDGESLNVYVTYTYDNNTSPLDLSGTSGYNILSDDSYALQCSDGQYPRPVFKNNMSEADLRTNQYIWQMESVDTDHPDPYDVQVSRRNLKYGNRDYHDHSYIHTSSYGSRSSRMNTDWLWEKVTSWRFVIVNGDTEDTYKLMAVSFADTRYGGYVDDVVADGITTSHYWYFDKYSAAKNPDHKPDITCDNDANVAYSHFNFQFIPVDVVNILYHVLHKITGVEQTYLAENVTAREQIVLPDAILRNYCDYTYYTQWRNNDVQTTDDTSTRAETCISANKVETIPFVTRADGDNATINIFVDYEVVTKDHPVEGIQPLPFNLIPNADTKAKIENLNYDEVFDLSTYDKRLAAAFDKTDDTKQGYLYFLVQNVNNDFAGGNQYFLQRDRQTGRVSYLSARESNDFELHKNVALNYQNWDYSHVAEYYRATDHDIFREKSWLWAFAGDPYDLYIFNMEAVAEESRDEVTLDIKVESTHPRHALTWQTRSKTNNSTTTTEYALQTPLYTESDKSFVGNRWGVGMPYGDNSDQAFSLLAGEMDGDGHFLPDGTNTSDLYYWRVAKSSVDNFNEVLLQKPAANTTILDYNLQVLPYYPVKYEDVNLVIRREDNIFADKSEVGTRVANTHKESDLVTQTTGLSELFFSASTRQFAQGDKITNDVESLPYDARRQFCDYTIYTDVYDVDGAYTVTAGPYREDDGRVYELVDGKKQYVTGTYDTSGATYTYSRTGYTTDGTDAYIIKYTEDVAVPGLWPQNVYVSYKVTSDLFLAKRPTEAEVKEMAANNDHVYFMEFTDNLEEEGYDKGHHAYFDEKSYYTDRATTLETDGDEAVYSWPKDADGKDLQQKDEYGDDIKVVNQIETGGRNRKQWNTVTNRMETVPENLKWYFVGDPYNAQVYCTAGAWGDDGKGNIVPANLCRFDPTESRHQFVVDCVHLRVPNKSIIDGRRYLPYFDPDATTLVSTGKVAKNPNYGKPFYDDFYWEVVPTIKGSTGDGEHYFALRFKRDNPLLSYRNVYYYLSGAGRSKTYVDGSYTVNLSYNKDNDRHLTGNYKGMHKANDKDCIIRLVQPAKVYVSAYKADETLSKDADFKTNTDFTAHSTQVTKEELSEYFGVGETIKEVPRHLQRKYVEYGQLVNTAEGAVGQTAAAITLSDNKTDGTAGQARNMESCEDHNGSGYSTDDTSGRLTGLATTQYYQKRASYKFNVHYRLDDLTNTEDGKQVHLFSTPTNVHNPDASQLTWVDMTVGGGNWFYFDKTNEKDTGNKLVAAYTTDGWKTGLKGLHWALIGDPYDFTMLNRRRYEDGTVGTDPMWLTVTKEAVDKKHSAAGAADSIIWYTSLKATDAMVPADPAYPDSPENLETNHTSTATAAATQNTHFSIAYWKLGGVDDWYLRTASLKTTVPDDLVGDYSNGDETHTNQTNNFWRMVRKDYTSKDGTVSKFEAVPYSLSARNEYNSDEKNLGTWNYSETMGGLGVTQQRAVIRTAVAKDDDQADNDCFDADIRIVNDQSPSVVRIEATGLELRYGKAEESLPYTLRRYGCTYKCYLDYVDNENRGIEVTDFDSDVEIKDGKTFRELERETSGNLLLTYVYTMDEKTEAFFTTESDAKTDDYTWMNTYFQWTQYYEGKNVEVEYYDKIFDHYVYSADGHIIDEVYRYEKKTKIVTDDKTPYYPSAYLNTHTSQTPVYADEGAQSEDDRQKWALIGDPYSFTMKNYAQFLKSSGSSVTLEGKNITTSSIEGEEQSFALAIDKSGNTYLSVIDKDGNVTACVTFTYSSTSDKSLQTAGSGINTSDPTYNTFNTGGARPFFLANLIKYADILQYHLVIAHQHSLDAEEDYLKDLSNDSYAGYTGTDNVVGTVTKADARQTVKKHLLEYLMYMGLSQKRDKDFYVNTSTSKGVLTPTSWDTGKEDAIKTLLKNASLRDIVSYPINDYNVSRVGIGNRPQVPWYMKRQFCTYKLYQRDVQRSVVTNRLAYLKNEQGQYVDWDGNVVDDDHKIQLYMDDEKTQPAYEIDWVSIFDDTHWSSPSATTSSDSIVNGKKIPRGYREALALQGQVLDKLQDCHYNRKVVIDVVYEVNPDQFRFADKGRNTTAWYQMMTNNERDGLMNFTYKDGIGARLDRHEHYTNNYLWAPEGDPYGFVMRSRYATINGTGWDDVVVTTTGHLPKSSTDTADSGDAALRATYTGRANTSNPIPFNNKRVVHRLSTDADADTDGATNAVYEMFVGEYPNSFLMHPTSAWTDNTNSDFNSYYLIHNTTDNTTALTLQSATALSGNADANWRLQTTAEQLWPYFERAGYVGGLEPVVANTFANRQLANRLKEYVEDENLTREYSVLNAARELVYSGTFYRSSGSVITNDQPRPSAATAAAGIDNGPSELPLRFESTNLVNMKPGYYRIRAFSQKALDIDGRDLRGDQNATTDDVGIVGPRYISGYRFESEKTDPRDPNNNGGRWLHFFETDQEYSTIHTFGQLKDVIKKADDAGVSDRDQFDHVAMRGNIEILPVEYDPSSIFHFTKYESSETYDRYLIGTQGLKLWARPGTSETGATVGTHEFGRTELVEETPSAAEGYNGEANAGNWDNKFRLEDIGGAAMTIRLRKTTADDWDDMVAENLKTNYVCIDRNHRYRITCHTNNEMVEIGDHIDQGDALNRSYAIQDTKWLLQPVGIKTDWPYNQMPLRVEVQEGGVKDANLTGDALTSDSNKDKYYYGSLYVPFDTRLGSTVDAAFTMTNTPKGDAGSQSVAMQAVSQLNGMGNPQYIPAEWPVVIRTNSPKSVTLENQGGGTYATKHYVDLYLPYDEPQSALDKEREKILLQGKYLEQTLTGTDAEGLVQTPPLDGSGKRVMVFGLPFDSPHASHNYDRTHQRVGWYTNENWMRGYGEGSIVTAGVSDDQLTSNDESAKTSFLADARSATDEQRDNRYVYHNKVYYVYTAPSASGAKPRIVALFDEDGTEWSDDEPDTEEDEDIDDSTAKRTPWPCDVYDLQGRKVATHETPQTLRANNPGLPKGVYIFGHMKVVVK